MNGARLVVGVWSLLWMLALPAAWSLGYRSAWQGLGLWLLPLLVAVTAQRLARRAWPAGGFADAIVRTSVIAFAVIVGGGLVLGAAGVLYTGAFLALVSAVFVWTTRWGRLEVAGPGGRPAAWPTLDGISLVPAAAIVALTAFIAGYGLSHSPLTLYDSLSYHLFFPARWLQEHRLSIIPTPFSDEAQAYAPGNGELYFLWLMLPVHGDLLARIGQLPFYLLAGVTLFALARRSGAPPGHAVYAPAFFLLARPIVGQAAGANVDLICAAMFLTSIYLGLAAVERDRARDWAIWGLSVGLYAGTKYLALVYLPVLLVFPLVRRVRPKALWAMPGILAFAAPWYLRNWIVAGSPIYPSSVKLAGVTIAQGAFGREATLDTVFHAADLRLLPAVATHALGLTLVVVWVPVAALATLLICVRRQWWPAGWLLLTTGVMVALEWYGLPVNVDSRFLLPAAGLAMLPFALLFGRRSVWNGCVHASYVAAMAWILIGTHAEVSTASLPWFMGGWLTADGVLDRRFAWWFAGALAATAFGWLATRGRPVWRAAALAATCGGVALALLLGAGRWCVPSTCDYLQTESPFIRTNYVYAWRWIDEHVEHATFAYTGINLPYPITGRRLTNRVYYVNIDRHLAWRFDDYARVRRRRTSDHGQFARASGELMATSAPVRATNEALRPRYERMDGDRDGWLENLRSQGIDHLFVAALSAYEIDWQWHNGQGFPIEDDWAKADPVTFPLVYENPQVRIYAVDFARRAGA